MGDAARRVRSSAVSERANPRRHLSELEVIARIRQAAGPSRSGAVRLGIGDDCAILAPPSGHAIVVTTDLFLESRHFRRDWHTPQSAGHRCLARGLSDLAAMGARPMAAFLSLALPAGYSVAWVDGFLAGLLALAREHRVPLAGGDTAQAPGAEILADIVLLGSVPAGRALRRSGARPGDRIFVTGALGGSAAELEQMAAAGRPSARRISQKGRPQSFPEPRLAAGQALVRRRLASAAIDLSDGLSTDLLHLAQASGVDAEIDSARLPLHPLSRGRLQLALHGGEDYELLFTAPAATKLPQKLAGVAVTEVGRIVRRQSAAPAVRLDGKPLRAAGWQHLAPRSME